MYAKIENNVVVEWPIPSLTTVFKNTSFPSPMTENAMPEGYVSVGVIPPPIGTNAQKVIPGPPIQLEGNKWVQSWEVVDLTPEEVQERYDIMATDVRSERNYLLAESDWSQVADAPVNKEIWATYRQQLRDVTKQPNFPYEVVWPNKPE